MTAKLIYFTTRTLDGYIEDAQGNIDWGAPDEERHLFINDALRAAGTHLYGRRLWETMQVWTHFGAAESDPPSARDFGTLWRAAQKVVYSRTLKQIAGPNVRLEHSFDPDAIRELKLRAEHELLISGAELTAQALKAGLVDELKLFIAPILVGGGKKAIPEGVRFGLELVDERRFADGFVFVHYRVQGG
jgi:dihydrofolate reductase